MKFCEIEANKTLEAFGNWKLKVRSTGEEISFKVEWYR